MKSITITQARQDLYNMVDETVDTSLPIQILGKRGNAILVSEDDWNSIQETLYLLSIPNMREQLIGGKDTPINECVEDIGWDIE
ncbi:MAG: type II toxin-antitoxin system Phd/YefM family antitoxin [Paenibacillaceae bacterium]